MMERQAARREGSGPTPRELITEFGIGLLVTVFWERLGGEWSTGTWVAVVLATVIVVGFVLAIRKRGSPGAAMAAIVAVLVGVAAAAALIIFWLEDSSEDQPTDACGQTLDADAVDVLVVWEGGELDAFCEVVAAYQPAANVTSTGTDIGAAIDARFDRDELPDAAIIPQPSLVREYAEDGRLCRTDDVAGRFPDQWNRLVSIREDETGPWLPFGAVVKGAHKSLLWYSREAIGDENPDVWTWDDLVTWISDHVDSSLFDAPLTVPAGDRWPLTDWFENQLAGTAPDVYGRLQEGDVDWDATAVRQALTDTLRDMADLWRDPRIFADGPEGAEATSWSDLPRQLDDERAAIAFGPSFVAGQLEHPLSSDAVWLTSFPRLREDTPNPLIVGGDFAVVPTRLSEECEGTTPGEDFVRWLTGREAIRLWSDRDPGFLTPNSGSPFVPDERNEVVQLNPEDNVRILLTALIRPGGDDEDGDILRFDLSDDQFARVNEGDARGTWNIFYHFFQDVTGDPRDLNCVIDQTIDRIEAEYRNERYPSPVCEE